MKTYCKNINILDVNFISRCIKECLDGKWRRTDVIHFLSEYSGMDAKTIRSMIKEDKKKELLWILDIIAEDIRDNIANRSIQLPPIRYSERYDGNSRKLRVIGTQSIIHQCYEYVAVFAAKELFYKKFGTYQCASIPNRGQSYGKRAIEKWVKNDIPGTRYAIKADIRKCYPSVNQEKIKQLLHRDLHKNPDLLYLLDTLIDMFDNGLSIGSHLSQWLCNYYLSYAYHYISEKLFITKKSKNGDVNNVRMLSHVIFYMDDIIIFGSNKKYLMKAMHLINEYFLNELSLTIKPDWRLFKVQYVDKKGKVHGTFVDMMGFRFYRGKTTIRRTIFIRLRRKFIKVRKTVKRKRFVSQKMSQSVMSYWGWVKHTNSYKFSREYEIHNLVGVARKQVSYFARKKDSANQKNKQITEERNHV